MRPILTIELGAGIGRWVRVERRPSPMDSNVRFWLLEGPDGRDAKGRTLVRQSPRGLGPLRPRIVLRTVVAQTDPSLDDVRAELPPWRGGAD